VAADAPGVAVLGITGRMGQSLVRALDEVPQALRLTGALASAGSHRLGRDAREEGAPTAVRVTADLDAALAHAAVALDFSTPAGLAAHAAACAARKVPLLVGVTGFDESARRALESAASGIAVLIAPNTSVGVGVLRQLVVTTASALGAEADVEIAEAHHRSKRDAPSGTALALGEAVCEARGQRLAEAAVFDRHGVSDARRPGSIGFSAIRAGDIVGEHTVTFAWAGERIELTHRATDRMVFARGAIRAAAWLIGRPPGVYEMRHVLGL
jgi:4-hydroxy-tetrahydrodipicolinate reductase